MYTKAFLICLFISLGITLPVFPVARPFIPSGLGSLPTITTKAYIVPRGLVNTEDGLVTGPIPEKWKHTHGVLQYPEPEAEKRSMNGGCGEGVACAGLKDLFHSFKDKILEELDDRDLGKHEKKELGDCKPWMWGC
ncbi:hypothetical protein G6011_02635 [Alternaria panax]|uniref:Uncharacterized protein n=1 Tax=Alternaria panax TaxID=48097 RepID=A0AAD4FEI1_9PLEO|nr:hypothetical protein G6011_02635 [Alternaria panax]